MRSRRSWTAGSMPTIACRAASSASAGTRSIRTSTLRRISREAASRTSPATEPPRSLPKWSAFEASAGLEYARAARHDAVVRARSMQITRPTTRSAYHGARTEVTPSTSLTMARQTMTALATTRIAPSASAARCSAFPCPYWWPGSAGRTATPTAKNVSSAAIRSVPECAASETRPRLCVASPVASLSAMSASAASTDQSAAFRWASTLESVRRAQVCTGSGGQMSASCRNAKWQQRGGQRERRDRGQLDLGLRRAEQPAVVVHLGARVGGEDPVALGEERLERAGLGVEGLVRGAIARREDPPRLADPHALSLLPVADRLQRHPRVEGGDAVDPAHAERGQSTGSVDAEEPHSGEPVRAAHVRAHVELQEGRDAGHGKRTAGPERTHAEEHEPEPRGPVVLLDLELVGHALPELDPGDGPVRPEAVLPGLAERPAARGKGERTVADAAQRARLPARRPRVVEEVRLPLLEVPAQRLLALDRLEQGLEVALAEGRRAVPLDHLEEDRRPVLRGLGEDLQQVAVVVAVDEDPVLLQYRPLLGDLAHAPRRFVVVGVGRVEKLEAALLHRLDGADDVGRRERDVLRAGAAVELDVLLDLALALALGRLVDRELDLPGAVRHDLGHEGRILGLDLVVPEVEDVRHPEHALVELDPVVHPAELDVADDVVDVREADALPGVPVLRHRDVAGQERPAVVATVDERVDRVAVRRDRGAFDQAELVLVAAGLHDAAGAA